MNDIVIGGYVCAHWLVADFEYSAKAAANRHNPLLTRGRQPVRCNEWRRRQIPAVRHIVVDEWLREERVHRRQQRITADRHRLLTSTPITQWPGSSERRL